MSKIRCAIYDRVSTELQVKEGLSLEAQKQALTDYALSRGYEIVGYYTDEGITARKKMQNRKDLLRLLHDVEADKIDLILVTKLDRWFRNIKDYHNTQAILEAHRCNWKTIFEEYDTSTANGRFAINIMLSVNENECDRTSDRIHSIFAYKKSRKEHLNGKPAYGYTTDCQKKLVKDPASENIVNEVFDYYFTVFSKNATIRYITEKYKHSPLCPTVHQISRILSSRTYTGQMYGINNYCPAYITAEQYEKIQSLHDSKIIPAQREPFLFSSMVKCPVCGKYMSGCIKRTQLKSGSISEHKRYRCNAKYPGYHSGACISETTIEKFLLSHMTELLPSLPLEILQTQKSLPKKPDKSLRIRAELERLNRLYQKGRIGEAYYEEQYSLLSEQLDSAASAENTPAVSALPKTAEPLTRTLQKGWVELYQELDPIHKKAFWKGLICAISIDLSSHKISGLEFHS